MKIFEIIIFLSNTEPLRIYMGIHTKIKKKISEYNGQKQVPIPNVPLVYMIADTYKR